MSLLVTVVAGDRASGWARLGVTSSSGIVVPWIGKFVITLRPIVFSSDVGVAKIGPLTPLGRLRTCGESIDCCGVLRLLILVWYIIIFLGLIE